jgi:hypothetical protein
MESMTESLNLKEVLKLKEVKIKSDIRKVFVFNDTWKRTHYICNEGTNDQIKTEYENATFENQRQFGRQIADAFDDMGIVNVLALAPTQSGKTGSMIAAIHELTRSDSHTINDVSTPISNIFIFTSHSSKDWVEQTKRRFPDCFKDNIFHRNHLKRFIKRVKGLRNVLIIFDECHIAINFRQTLYTLYRKLGLFNIQSLYKRNIKLLHFTATPGTLAVDLMDNWGESAKCINMQVPHNYISHHQFSEQKQLFQAKPLFGNDDAIIELLDHMDEKPAFHLIRTPRGDKHAALISQFKTIFKDKLFEYWSEPTLAQTGIDFTQMINQPPDVHTFLFIIDKIRCAKTINIENINIVYDRFVKKPDSDSIIQGFAGRCTGYHKHYKHIKLFSFKEIILNHQCEHSLNDSKHKGNIFKPF